MHIDALLSKLYTEMKRLEHEIARAEQCLQTMGSSNCRERTCPSTTPKKRAVSLALMYHHEKRWKR